MRSCYIFKERLIKLFLEEVKIGLDIIQKKQNNSLPNESWNEMKTIQYEVMLIISKISKSNKVLDICENYFKNITKNYKRTVESQVYNINAQNDIEIQKYKEETENTIKILEQTIALLDENYK